MIRPSSRSRCLVGRGQAGSPGSDGASIWASPFLRQKQVAHSRGFRFPLSAIGRLQRHAIG
jgi:hypothetical protein